jgi:hypothetical protein
MIEKSKSYLNYLCSNDNIKNMLFLETNKDFIILMNKFVKLLSEKNNDKNISFICLFIGYLLGKHLYENKEI